MAARYAARFRAAEASAPQPQVTHATKAEIVNHYHGPSIHIHSRGAEEAASLIRNALIPELPPGTYPEED